MFSDKPAPGKGYVTFIISVLVFLLAVMIFSSLKAASRSNSLALLVIIQLLPVAIFYAIIHAAYHTEYKILNDFLEMRSGFIIKDEVRLDSIDRVKKVKFINRVLGWGPSGKGIANRFKSGLLISAGRKKVFISPSHVDQFIEQLNSFSERDLLRAE